MSTRTVCGSRHGRWARLRSWTPTWDYLEARALLSVTPVVVQPTFELEPLAGPGSANGAYAPAQIAQAYGFNSISFNGVAGTGRGETIAIVDAYDDPNIQTDLNTFDTRFGLPAGTVIRVNQNGGTAYPASDPTGGWEVEESLDVEWAHAMAPQAAIMLVEANSDNGNDLLAAVSYAASQANVVSMSWGGGEFSGETGLDSSYFDRSGVAFVASSGDAGAPASWPAVAPDVLSVGGTALYVGAGNAWSSESGWNGSGGGPSVSESQPSYQNGVVTQTSASRATPDVAYDASPSTGVAVYDSVLYNGKAPGWIDVGGTSAGAPQWSALLAIADQGRASSGQPALDSNNPQEVMNILYTNLDDFHDIQSGTSTGSPHYSSGRGYDYVTGLGSPVANLVVGSLVGTPKPAPSADTLLLSAPSAETAGNSFGLVVTAQTASGITDTVYQGTLHFTSSDVQAGLPANFTFTAADHGTYTFAVTLKSAGSQSITATDTASSGTTGTLAGITVSPAAANRFIASGIPSSATPGVAQTLSVTAEDPYGNVSTAYAGTVKFTSSDPAAILPANYSFMTGDQGVHTFSLTFETAGTQSVTVQDISSGITGSQTGINVGLAAPTKLVASPVSSTAIGLTWTGSTGATGYLIQESLNSGAGWVQVGSTSGGTTSFEQTGLTTGFTYYYRVLAIAGNFDSGYSNVASATLGGSGSSPGDTIWSNSYVPEENASSSGSYEVGVKFTAAVAGKVTGVRFYKQTAMGGNVHIGHLWSSTGKLLATATFTNESASGWQQVSFSSPVPIQADTVYVVSFSTGGGDFGSTTKFFASSGVTRGPLQALSNGVTGGDGVYNRAGSFPDQSGNGTNYWADVAFTPSYGGVIAHAAPQPPRPNAVGGFGITLSTAGQSSRLLALAEAAAPSRPARFAAGLRGTIPAVLSVWSIRGLVRQAAARASWLTLPRRDFSITK
ncbi:MAG: DUF4082 domain-containing protein [Isosphaeraceae bacterium]